MYKLYPFLLFCSFMSLKRWLIVLVLEINPGPVHTKFVLHHEALAPGSSHLPFSFRLGNTLSGFIVTVPVRLHNDKT